MPQRTRSGAADEAGLLGIRSGEAAGWVSTLLVYSGSVELSRLRGKLQVVTA